MILIILGPQGSGKSTQAQLLAKDFNLYYFDAGAFLRQLAKTHPDIDEIIDKKGALLPDNEMFKLFVSHLGEENVSDNIILDGYPRSLPQLELLQTWLGERNKKIDLAIFINISQEESIKRLSTRRIDPKNGEIYNIITNPPPANVNIYNLTIREDDKPDAIKERLMLYHEVTSPIIGKLRKMNILFEINGEQRIETIHKIIEKQVRKVING